MKKTILIELLLSFVAIILTYRCAYSWYYVSLYIDTQIFNDGFQLELSSGILFILSILAIIAVMVLTALKNFKRITDKLQARKEKRNQVKAERAEAEKQKRIAALQSELEELKKDE